MFVLAALAVTIGALESIPFPALPLLQRELGLDPAATCGIARTIGAALGVQAAAALLTGTGASEVGFPVAAVVALLPLTLLRGIPGRSDEGEIRSGAAAAQV
jgi:hypothetical protein